MPSFHDVDTAKALQRVLRMHDSTIDKGVQEVARKAASDLLARDPITAAQLYVDYAASKGWINT